MSLIHLGWVARKKLETVLNLESIFRLREVANDLLCVTRNDVDLRHHMAFDRKAVTSIDLKTKKGSAERPLSAITISI